MGDTIRRLTATGYSSHRPARARPAVRRRCRPLSSSSSSSSSGSRGGIVLRMITKELRSINLVENSWGMYGRMLMRRAHEADAPKDKRFKHPEWSENAISILSAVREVKGMDDAHPMGCFLCWPSPNAYSLAMIAGIVACPSTILPPQRSPGRPPCWSHSFMVTRRCSAFCPPSELDIEEPRVTTE